MAKATEKQIQGLRAYGITPPATKGACGKILDYLFKAGEGEGRRRLALILAAQKTWVGKKVRRKRERNDGPTGVVLCVLRTDDPGRDYPLFASCVWGKGKDKHHSQINFGDIEVVPE